MFKIPNAMLLLFCCLFSLQTAWTQPPQNAIWPTAWQQKVWVQVSKPFFVAGEPLWFSVFVNQKPANLEKIAFAELFNSRQQPVLQTLVTLQQGKGSGSWLIPKNLPTGNYLLRAYTNAQKNKGPAHYVETLLTIVNTTQAPDWATLQDEDSLQVKLYPESGSLVYGLPNAVTVWTGNQYGEGFAATGALINQQQDTLVRFTTTAQGAAAFIWTPKNGERYRIAVQAGPLKTMFAVPAPATEGMVMELNSQEGKSIVVKVTATPAFGGKPVFLTAGEKIFQAAMQNGSASFTLATEDLPVGSSALMLFDVSGKLQASRWWHRREADSLQIGIRTEQQVLGLRQRMEVAVGTAKANGAAIPASFSVSVYRVDSLQTAAAGSGTTFVSIGATTAHFGKRQDTALVSSWFRSMGMPWTGANRESDFPAGWVYLPQYEGPQLLVRITEPGSNKPVAGIMAYLSLPGQSFQFTSGVSDSAGLVRFNLKDFVGARNAVISLHPKDRQYMVALLPFFDPRPPVTPMPRFRLPEAWAEQLQQHHLAAQVQSAFHPLPLSAQGVDATDTLPFFGVPHHAYFLDDYTRFPTMEEVFREFVPEVIVRKRGGGLVYRVYNGPYQEFFEELPLTLADGLPMFDPDSVMAIDPLKVKKLDLVTGRFALGRQVFDGIMSLTSYNGTGADMPVSTPMQKAALAGVMPGPDFTPVDYSKAANSRIPDQRLQLFWAPYLKTDSSGEARFLFYTADVPGRYLIVVHGLAADGTAGSAVRYFDVVK